MLNETTVFNLASGPECEVKKMVAKHQKMLTDTSVKSHSQKLSNILKDLIVRVGEVHFDRLGDKEKNDFILEMLTADKQLALIKIRNYTNQDDPDFVFEYSYADEKGQQQKVTKIMEITEDSFSFKPVMIFDQQAVNAARKRTDWEIIEKNSKPLAATNYSEVLASKVFEFTLADCGKTIRLSRKDGHSDVRGAKIDDAEMNSHMPILVSGPQWLDESGTWINFTESNLDTLSIRDIESIRRVLKIFEARVDTELMFENPEAKYKVTAPRNIIINLMQQESFFFPSGGI